MEARDTRASQSGLAAAVVRLAGAWILAGAIAKLFLGTPKDLPELVRDLTPFTLDLTFHLVIAVELVLAATAFLRPKAAWLPLVLLLVFFDAILTKQLSAGAESCGCFGATIKVSPWLMLAVDSVLLLALLATQPWKIARRGAPVPWLAGAVALAIAAPWIFIRSGAVAAPGPGAGAEAGAETTAKPDYVELRPKDWVGKTIWDVAELTAWIDASALPAEGTIVLWRKGCDHCAAHLRAMAQADDGARPVLLAEVRDDPPGTTPLVDLMPSGPHVAHVQFPDGLQFILETPWEIRLEGGVVTAALGREDFEE